MYNGYMASQIDSPSLHCPTSNCSWPKTTTVGVCGACLDITDDIEFSRSSSDEFHLSTPGGIELTGHHRSRDSDTVFAVGPSSGKIFASSPEIPKRDSPNVIAEFGAMGIPPNRPPSATLNESLAAECAMWYCLQGRHIFVDQGNLTDEVYATWIEVSDNDADTSGISFINIPPQFRTIFTGPYGVEAKHMTGIRDYANKTFTGKITVDSALRLPSTDFAEGLFNGFGDVDSWMRRLTASMTNEARRNGPPPTGASLGQAFDTEIVFHVRWEWISYPAVLVGISVVYLVVEMVRTRTTGAKPWKDDPYVPVCMTTDEGIRERARDGLYKPGGMAKCVGEVMVRIDTKDGPLPAFIAKGPHA